MVHFTLQHFLRNQYPIPWEVWELHSLEPNFESFYKDIKLYKISLPHR